MSNKPLLCSQCDKLKEDIENHKQKLNHFMKKYKYDLSNNEVISCSEEIDRLIIKYIQCIGMKNKLC